MKPKAASLRQPIHFDRNLARQMKKKREKTQITKIRNERSHITTDSIHIKRTIYLTTYMKQTTHSRRNR